MATPGQDTDLAQLPTSVAELQALLQRERAASTERVNEFETPGYEVY